MALVGAVHHPPSVVNDAGWCVRHNCADCTCGGNKARRRASGTSMEAKLRTWGDCPDQVTIDEAIDEST